MACGWLLLRVQLQALAESIEHRQDQCSLSWQLQAALLARTLQMGPLQPSSTPGASWRGVFHSRMGRWRHRATLRRISSPGRNQNLVLSRSNLLGGTHTPPAGPACAPCASLRMMPACQQHQDAKHMHMLHFSPPAVAVRAAQAMSLKHACAFWSKAGADQGSPSLKARPSHKAMSWSSKAAPEPGVAVAEAAEERPQLRQAGVGLQPDPHAVLLLAEAGGC